MPAKKKHTSFRAAVSDMQANVISHDWTTSDGLLPFKAPSLTYSRHYTAQASLSRHANTQT